MKMRTKLTDIDFAEALFFAREFRKKDRPIVGIELNEWSVGNLCRAYLRLTAACPEHVYTFRTKPRPDGTK